MFDVATSVIASHAGNRREKMQYLTKNSETKTSFFYNKLSYTRESSCVRMHLSVYMWYVFMCVCAGMRAHMHAWVRMWRPASVSFETVSH